MSTAYRGRTRSRIAKQQPDTKKSGFGKKLAIQIICSLFILALIYFVKDSENEKIQSVNERIKLTLNQNVNWEGVANPFKGFLDKNNSDGNTDEVDFGTPNDEDSEAAEQNDGAGDEELPDVGELLPVNGEIDDEVRIL